MTKLIKVNEVFTKYIPGTEGYELHTKEVYINPSYVVKVGLATNGRTILLLHNNDALPVNETVEEIAKLINE